MLSFSIGKPFRKPFYTNKLFLLSCIVLAVIDLVLLFIKIGPLDDLMLFVFEIKLNNQTISAMPYSFVIVIFTAAVVNSILTWLCEFLL